ncbi:MAG: hypothetical protein M3R53_08550 [Candidatus Eremiobacteraeota bacterium]|nr:hypothetical protein [Candidatus Eremiobacteraeota bacterium]
MNDRSDTTAAGAKDVPERAQVIKETLKLSPETAAAAAENETATGMRKPGSNAVDEARAAEARATEPREDDASHR